MAAVRSLRNRKILITSGPTWVAIDDTRIISNRSTGELGQLLGDGLAAAGARVVMIKGPVARPQKNKNIKTRKYLFFDELLRLLKKELKSPYDAVIHAAAVSDYRPVQTGKTKIPSGQKRLRITLTPTEKIINLIKKFAPKVFLVGFKLESSGKSLLLKEKAARLFTDAGCDLVVANSLARGRYQGYILTPLGKIVARASSRNQMSQQLIKVLGQLL